MARVREAGLGMLFVGAALLKLGLLDDAAAWLKPQAADEGHMSSSNPWAKDYKPPPPRTAPTRTPSVYYRNCAAARAAGAAPLSRSDPGYRPELDRDGDGIACEPYRR